MAFAYHSDRKEFVVVEAGFVIAKTFARLYDDYKGRYDLRRDCYAMPRVDRDWWQSPVQYRGLDRDALCDWQDSELPAEVHLALLEIDGCAVNGIVFRRPEAQEVHALLGNLQPDYEIIWSRVLGSNAAPPEGLTSVGFEATYFTGDHFSASCDCMLFPRWHGTDEEGELFRPHFQQLNAHGLFATPDAAQEFLGYYRSFDWTETGDYVIAEVFIEPQS